MKVLLTRDSVCSGDDAEAPHEREQTFPGDLAVRDLLVSIVADGYLASIAGGRATWVVRTTAGVTIAIVAQQWNEPRLLATGQGLLASLADPDGTVRLHLQYLAQQDPDAVHTRLSETPAREFPRLAAVAARPVAATAVVRRTGEPIAKALLRYVP